MKRLEIFKSLLQSLVQIVNDVLLKLKTNAQPDQVVSDADLHSLLLFDAGVSHQVGQLGQGLVAAQGLGQGHLQVDPQFNSTS